jgi:hypothetical protein
MLGTLDPRLCCVDTLANSHRWHYEQCHRAVGNYTIGLVVT